MNSKNTEELKALQKEMVKVSVLDAPGAILVGLAVYAKFGANGAPFHPILNNEPLVIGMFIVGGAIMLWGASQVLAISKRRKALENS